MFVVVPFLSSVLFIEYHFPVTTSQTCHAQEVMRVASRKMAGTGGEMERRRQHGWTCVVFVSV